MTQRSLNRVCALSLVLAVVVGCGADSEGGAGAGEPGVAAEEPLDLAPNFTLKDMNGGDVTLSDLKGKTVVIDFWATWCPPCEFQVPELNAFWQAHREDGDVAVLGISVDTEGPEVVGAWIAEKGVDYPILLGDDDLARRFGAMGFPTLVIVAPNGSVDSRHVGLIEHGDLEEALARQRADASI